MSEKIWYEVASNFINAAKLPFPINDTVIEVMKTIMTEEQAKFLLLFKKSSYNIDEVKTISNLDEDSLMKMLKDLMHIGAITGIPSRSTGIMVYRLTPFFPGVLEFTLMRGETGEKEKKLAKLFDKFFKELVEMTQGNYDRIMKALKNANPIDRIIPVEEEVEIKEEKVFTFEEISKVIEKYDPIGLMTCYCRHRKDLLNDPCKKTKDRKNCFSFGKAASFLISEGFAEQISKEEAKTILKQCEDDGLVHKGFHVHLDPERELDGMCNCCKCCCGTFDIHYAGGIPLMSLASHVANVNEDDCIGCGTCVEMCNAEAVELEDTLAVVNEDRCIGCGICAHFCPEKAMTLVRIEPRKVFVPPPKLTTN
ncbi:MAG: ATP-binding protein [Candidatus Hodarchaeota archaeon]